MRVREVYLLVCAVIFAGLLCGCGGDASLDRKAVSGTVTLYGVPIEQGVIEFHPLSSGGAQSGGVISEGRYSIPRAYGPTVGEYRVQVRAPEEPPKPLPEGFMPGDDPPPEPKPLIPPGWSETIEVTDAGPFEFDFKIEAGAGK